VYLLQLQHGYSGRNGAARDCDQESAAALPGRLARKISLPDYELSITDSKQPERQGQRLEAGFLWIREAAIPLLKESPKSSAELGFLKGFRAVLAPPEQSRTGEFFDAVEAAERPPPEWKG
jgi:hypothetical protein